MKPETAVRLDRTVGRFVYPVHRTLYRLTGGRIGQKSAQGPILLLTTTGRKSGQARTHPLLYMPDGDNYVVVASNGGRDQPPAWWLNLRAQPRAEIQVGRDRIPVQADVLGPAEKEEIWPRVTAFYQGWGHYQMLTNRDIPVVVLRPVR